MPSTKADKEEDKILEEQDLSAATTSSPHTPIDIRHNIIGDAKRSDSEDETHTRKLYNNHKDVTAEGNMKVDDTKRATKQVKRRKESRDGMEEILHGRGAKIKKGKTMNARSVTTEKNPSSSNRSDTFYNDAMSSSAVIGTRSDTILDNLRQSRRTSLPTTVSSASQTASSQSPSFPQQQNRLFDTTRLSDLDTMLLNHPSLDAYRTGHQGSDLNLVANRPENMTNILLGRSLSLFSQAQSPLPQEQGIIPNDSISLLRSIAVQQELIQQLRQQVLPQREQQHHPIITSSAASANEASTFSSGDEEQHEYRRRLLDSMLLPSSSHGNTTIPPSFPLRVNSEEELSRRLHHSPYSLSQPRLDGAPLPFSLETNAQSRFLQQGPHQAGQLLDRLFGESFLPSFPRQSIATATTPNAQFLQNRINIDSTVTPPSLEDSILSFLTSQNTRQAPLHSSVPSGLSLQQPNERRDNYLGAAILGEQQLRYLQSSLLQENTSEIPINQVDRPAIPRLQDQQLPLFPGDSISMLSTNIHKAEQANNFIPSSTSGASPISSTSVTGDRGTSHMLKANKGDGDVKEHPPQGSAPITQLGNDGFPVDLPCVLALPDDGLWLSPQQVFLRQQILVFRASKSDISTHKRGRNKPVVVGQVGIRCRHCAHIPVVRIQKGSLYFPATIHGLYQAAQNMSTIHLQCGLCSEMPELVRQKFSFLLSIKGTSSGAGRPHWEKAARKVGLVDSPNGIRFIRDEPLQSTGENEGEMLLEQDDGSQDALKLPSTSSPSSEPPI